MKWLLLVFLLSDYQALTPAKQTAFRTATRNIINAIGDKDSFTPYTNGVGQTYWIAAITREQIDERPAQLKAYRDAVTNAMPNAVVEMTATPAQRLRELGLGWRVP